MIQTPPQVHITQWALAGRKMEAFYMLLFSVDAQKWGRAAHCSFCGLQNHRWHSHKNRQWCCAFFSFRVGFCSTWGSRAVGQKREALTAWKRRGAQQHNSSGQNAWFPIDNNNIMAAPSCLKHSAGAGPSGQKVMTPSELIWTSGYQEPQMTSVSTGWWPSAAFVVIMVMILLRGPPCLSVAAWSPCLSLALSLDPYHFQRGDGGLRLLLLKRRLD